MNVEEYLIKLNGLDDELLAEADGASGKKYFSAAKLVIAAACIVLIIGAIFVVPGISGEKTEGSGDAGIGQEIINMSGQIRLIGEELAFSSEEGRDFLEENFVSLKSSLEASGVDCRGIIIAGSGYCHLRIGEDGGSMALNWRDYLIYGENGNIISIATVVNEKERMSYTLAFGADWKGYSAFLKENAGKELAYLYIGGTGESEAVLLADGRLYYTGSGSYGELPETIRADDLRCGQNIYIP